MVTDAAQAQGKEAPRDSRPLIHELQKAPEPIRLAGDLPQGPGSAQVKNPADLGHSWEAANSIKEPQQRAQAFGVVTNEITKSAQEAFKTGGMDAVLKLSKNINDNVNGPTGPFLVPGADGKSIDIRHVREAQPFEPGAYQVPGFKNTLKDVAEAKLKIPLETKRSEAAGAVSDKVKEASPQWGDKIEGAAKLAPSPYVFQAMSEAMGPGGKWNAHNGAQQELLKQSASLGPEVDNLKKLGLLDGAAANSPKTVNEMFARHGIPITLKDQGRDHTYAGGVFDYKANWDGKPSHLDAKDENGNLKTYDSFQKPVKTFNVNGTTVIEVHRDDAKGTTLYMAMPQGDQKGYNAYNTALELTPGARTQADVYSKANIPDIKFRDKGNLPQMVGMGAPDGGTVGTAILATSLDMDAKGAEIKQGLGVVTTRGIAPRENMITVDKPPLVWVVQDGASKPLIAVQVGQEAWMDPKK